MKKLLFALSTCALFALLLLPSPLTRKAAAQKVSRPATAKGAPAAPAAARPRPAQQPETVSKNAEAFTTAPGVSVDPKKVKEVARPEVARAEAGEEDEDESVESDIDPETLRLLKQQPWRAPQGPAPYTTHEDGKGKGTGERQPFAPAQVRSFTGVGSNENRGLSRPPDPDMAAGQNHVVTVVNTMYAIYDKTTGTRVQPVKTLASLYANVCPTCDPFDPRVIYDPLSNRWAIMALHFDDPTHQSNILLAVSQTSDPTGAWWTYKLEAILNFNGEDTWADYPDLSFDGIAPENGGALYITTNQFTFSSRSSRTATLYVLPKTALYAGDPLNYLRANNRKNADGSQAFTLRAAKTYGNPGVEYLINTRNNGSTVSLWRVVPTYPPATDVDWTLQATVNIGKFSPAPPAAQPGCGNTLDTGDNRMYNAVWRNNRIYAAFTEARDWGGGGGTVSAVRYVKVNTTTNAAEINEQYGADGANYFFPAIATDSADNIVLVFVRSGAGEFGGIRYTGRRTADTQLQDSALLKAGVECLTGTRYGDYQGAAVDPADQSKVWIYGQWAASVNVGTIWDWGTWIGQVQFGGGAACNYKITPTTTAAPAAGINGSIAVTTGCAWTATSSAPWLTINSGSSGNGNGTISYSVAANTGASRVAAITVGDQILTVAQGDAACAPTPISYGQTVSGTLTTSSCHSALRTSSYAAPYTFNGTAGQQIVVALSSSSFDSYLHLYGPTGTVAQDDDGGGGTNSRIPTSTGSYTLPATGTYTIEATTYSPTTTGSFTLSLTLTGTCSYSIAPTAQTVAAGGGNVNVTVTAGSGCPWTATSNSGFITVSPDSGSGNGTVTLTVAANGSGVPRTGTATIAGQTFTVTQPEQIPTVTAVHFSAASYNVGEGDGRLTVTVTRTGDASGTSTVDYKTVDADTFTVNCAATQGTAFGRCDFATSLDTLTFAAGQTQKTFTVPIIDDAHVEGNETFQVVLSNAVGAIIDSPSTATVTITDNDTAAGANPVFTSPFFIRQHYLDFLAREPDQGGFNAYLNLLNGCPDVNNINPPPDPSAPCDRLTVSGAFFGSPEFKDKGVYTIVFYRAALGRLPKYAEFVQDLRAVTGATQAETFAKRAAFAVAFTQRAEFTTAYGGLSDAAYVAALLGRYSLTQITTPDPQQPDGSTKVVLTQGQLTSQLTAGALTRAQVLRAVVQSDEVSVGAEAVNAFVASQYYGYLRRTPDTGGFNGWVNYLTAHPTDFRTMVNGFVNSSEYRLRFGQP